MHVKILRDKIKSMINKRKNDTVDCNELESYALYKEC